MVDNGRVDGTRTRTLVWCWLLCLLPHTRARLSSKDLRTVYEQDMWEDFFQRVGVMGLKIPRSITSKCGTNKKPTIGSFDLGRITFASLNV